MIPIKSLNINSLSFINFNINKNYKSSTIHLTSNNKDIYLQTPLLNISKFNIHLKLLIDNFKNEYENDFVKNIFNLENFVKQYIHTNPHLIKQHNNIYTYIPNINNNGEFNISIDSNTKFYFNKKIVPLQDIIDNLSIITSFKFVIKCNGLYFDNNQFFIKWSIILIKFIINKNISNSDNLIKLSDELDDASKLNKNNNKNNTKNNTKTLHKSSLKQINIDPSDNLSDIDISDLLDF